MFFIIIMKMNSRRKAPTTNTMDFKCGCVLVLTYFRTVCTWWVDGRRLSARQHDAHKTNNQTPISQFSVHSSIPTYSFVRSFDRSSLSIQLLTIKSNSHLMWNVNVCSFLCRIHYSAAFTYHMNNFFCVLTLTIQQKFFLFFHLK